MKKLIAVTFLVTLCSIGLAQNSGKPTASAAQQVIQKIPSLSAIAAKIAKYESKVEGRKEQYKNSDADLKALKMKYASELTVQITTLKEDKETVKILNDELEKTNKEITNLN